MKKAFLGRKYEGWFKKERCTLPFIVECQCKQDCCWLEVNLVTLTYWGCCKILYIGVSPLVYRFSGCSAPAITR